MDQDARAWEKIWRADPSNVDALGRAVAALYRSGQEIPADLQEALRPSPDLFDRIREAPDDDGPRLAHARWLQTLGDPRGDFIVAQVALAGSLPWSDRVELRRKTARLLETHQARWTSAVRKFTTEFSFERGFVQRVKGWLDRFLDARGRAAVDAEPILDADLAGATPPLARTFAASPMFGVLRRLKLQGSLDASAVEALVQSPHMPRITALNLRCELDTEAATVLASAPSLAGLRMLSLSGNLIHDEGVEALAASPHLARLEALFLSRTGLTEQGVEALAGSPHLRRLTRLGLNGNDLEPESVETLRAALPSVKALEVG